MAVLFVDLVGPIVVTNGRSIGALKEVELIWPHPQNIFTQP